MDSNQTALRAVLGRANKAVEDRKNEVLQSQQDLTVIITDMLAFMPKPALTHSELVAALAKPGVQILSSMTPDKAHLLHMAVGFAGEVCEEIHPVIFNFYRLFMQGELSGSLDRVNLKEEGGDAEFYLEGYRQSIAVAGPQLVREMANYTLPSKFEVWTTPEKLLYASSCAVHAAGSLLDATKRWVIYGKPLDMNAAIAALANGLWALNLMYGLVGLTREAVLDGNIAKLAVRNDGNKYSDAAAIARADKAPVAAAGSGG